MIQAGVRNIIVENQEQSLWEIAGVGAGKMGSRLMAPKAVHRVIKLSGILPKQANIIKQEMLAKGGEAAVAKGVIDNSVEETDVLLMGTLKQYEDFLSNLKMQPFGLDKLAEEIKKTLQNLEGRPPFILNCRGKLLEIGRRTLIMGILNVTPDSFSDGGKYFEPGQAMERARQMVEEGADLIDLGGESTRPGSSPVDLEEELKRVLPALEKLLQEVEVPVSVDTYKAEVARQALEMGAHIINDQWALRADQEMARVVARYEAPLIMMHNQRETDYQDLMGDIIRYFRESLKIAELAGIEKEKIIIDPGIGFGKTTDQNLKVMKKLRELACLGQPILIGTSRKSMIGNTLKLPVDERLEGTAATIALGIAYGVDIVRVHDVKEMVRVVRMTDAIVR